MVPNRRLRLILLIVSLLTFSPFVDGATTLKLNKHPAKGASNAIQRARRGLLEPPRDDLRPERAIKLPLEPHSRSPQGKRRRFKRYSGSEATGEVLDARNTPGMVYVGTDGQIYETDISDTTTPQSTSLSLTSSSSTLASSTLSSVAVVTGLTTTSSQSTMSDKQMSSTSLTAGSSTVPIPSMTSMTTTSFAPLVTADNSFLDNPEDGFIYTIDLTVRNATLPVQVDTGSNQLWVPAPQCEQCARGGMTMTNLTWEGDCDLSSITYGSGGVDGCLVNATISFGEYQLPSLEVVAVTGLRNGMERFGGLMSGILGLAGETNPDGSNTALKALFEADFLVAETVGFYLSMNDTIDSEITFGDVTTSQYADASQSVTVHSLNYSATKTYEVIMDSFKVNDVVVGAGVKAVVDTGSSFLGIPEDFIVPLFNAFKVDVSQAVDGSWTLPCTSVSDRITLTFGGMDFVLAYEYLVYGPEVEGSNDCYARISAMTGLDFWLIGDTFLHTVYTSFNVGNGDITFYKLAE